ncbi:hypothetical protein [Halohasta litorea]|uniref:Uncharacterized protein n=1 Tax=Halohasta litorea TaxID=869891 RepID=A0ABD6D660_9EURY|nr:hypothetical protein [Halohasta litorea]
MPSEKLIPYKLEIHEKNYPESKYDLSSLHTSDPTLPDDNIIDSIENFLTDLEGENLKDPKKEKTFIVEQLRRNGNVIDGYISTGDYGYEAELKHVDTGDLTHEKGELEAEQMPFYFMFYLPETVKGEIHGDGERLIFVLQQINNRGIKTALKNKLLPYLLENSENSVGKVRPVYTTRVYEQLIDSNRVMRLDVQINKLPGDDESRSEIIKGLSVEDTREQTLVLKAEQGGSIEKAKEIVRKLKDSNKEFAEIVSNEVEQVDAKVKNSGGRYETIPLMKNQMAMRRDLTGDGLEYDKGLLTPECLRDETKDLLTDIFNSDIVKPPEFGNELDR